MTITGNVLITGGSGTLGHAIVRTAQAEHWDCQITIYSRSELRQAEMRAKYPHCRYVLGDVRDYERLSAAVVGHDLVIHAAAMKRIPEAEAQPWECYQTNVIGSHNVVRACVAGGVQRAIGISTDKACQAITAYGASKLAMEKLFYGVSTPSTVFTLVRYGNVIGSNGSVIPLWRQQAAAGKALTITDRRCTRFWMTERDAVRTIEVAAAALPGATIVPKMCSLSIVDMAHIIAPDCDTTEIGLRSYEKIHEDLVHLDEPCVDRVTHFELGLWRHHHGDTAGYRYTSADAPRLSRDQFLAMLAESEAQHA